MAEFSVNPQALKSKNASGGNTSIDNSSKTYNYFNDYGLDRDFDKIKPQKAKIKVSRISKALVISLVFIGLAFVSCVRSCSPKSSKDVEKELEKKYGKSFSYVGEDKEYGTTYLDEGNNERRGSDTTIYYYKDDEGNVEEDKKFLSGKWSYFELQTMIEQKSLKAGIKVNKIRPAYTSQTCSCCGVKDEKNRESTSFVCHNPQCNMYMKEIHADYNAARNIAKSKEIVK